MMGRSLRRLRQFLSDPLRAAVALAVIGLGIFVGIGVYQAGLETPAVPMLPPTQLDKGVAEGRRITGQSWSFDYDSVRMTPDGAIADIDGVHDGNIYRYGKPFLRMTAKHITVNTQTNDFNATGPIRIEQITKAHRRTFKTDSRLGRPRPKPSPCPILRSSRATGRSFRSGR